MKPNRQIALVIGALGFCAALGAGPAGPRARADLPPLNFETDQPRLPGKFVWADLVTDDVRAAATFYTRLFGWTFRDAGSYLIASNDDRPLCGIFYRARPKDNVAEPRWFGYISVSNVGKAERTVTKAGGRVLAPAKEMPKRGEQAVCADAEGAIFGLIRSSSGDPDDFLPDVGDWVWVELVSRDARKAAEFYRAVAGYDIVENTTSQRSNDYVLVNEGYARAAALTLPPDKKNVPPTWLLFVRVKDVTASAAQATQLGGKVLLAPKPDLFDGKLAVVTDPTGAAIGLLEWGHEQIKGKP